MASAKLLRTGMSVIIKSGPFRNLPATVVDPAVMPDGHVHQRKMLVDIEGVGEEWIIPKLIDIPGYPTASQHTANVAPSNYHPERPVVMTHTPITSLDDPALDSFRPQRAGIIKEYVSRVLPGGKKDIAVLTSYWERRKDGYSLNVGMVGDTQSGKTMLVEVMAHVIAKRMGLTKPLPVFTLAGSSAITDHDLFGQYRPDSSGQLLWMEGIVALAARLGGILYLDEINAMPGSVTAALHPLLDDRRSFINIRKPVVNDHGVILPEVIKCSTDLWVLCTYNPGYAGMSRTNEAFANRFVWLPWGYDESVEKRLIKSPAIRLLGLSLRAARETRAITTPIGTSALQRLEADIACLGVDYALWAFQGQFTNRTEASVVEEIINDRTIKQMIEAELADPMEEAEVTSSDEVTEKVNGWETF
jgi:MoxR-like ATPase